MSICVVFVNPYYTSTIRRYVAVPYPTGERVELRSADGEKLAEASNPGDRWAELLARQVAWTAEEIEAAESSEEFE